MYKFIRTWCHEDFFVPLFFGLFFGMFSITLFVGSICVLVEATGFAKLISFPIAAVAFLFLAPCVSAATDIYDYIKKLPKVKN
jgi:hypothetical protein